MFTRKRAAAASSSSSSASINPQKKAKEDKNKRIPNNIVNEIVSDSENKSKKSKAKPKKKKAAKKKNPTLSLTPPLAQSSSLDDNLEDDEVDHSLGKESKGNDETKQSIPDSDDNNDIEAFEFLPGVTYETIKNIKDVTRVHPLKPFTFNVDELGSYLTLSPTVSEALINGDDTAELKQALYMFKHIDYIELMPGWSDGEKYPEYIRLISKMFSYLADPGKGNCNLHKSGSTLHKLLIDDALYAYYQFEFNRMKMDMIETALRAGLSTPVPQIIKLSLTADEIPELKWYEGMVMINGEIPKKMIPEEHKEATLGICGSIHVPGYITMVASSELLGTFGYKTHLYCYKCGSEYLQEECDSELIPCLSGYPRNKFKYHKLCGNWMCKKCASDSSKEVIGIDKDDGICKKCCYQCYDCNKIYPAVNIAIHAKECNAVRDRLNRENLSSSSSSSTSSSSLFAKSKK